MISPFGARSAHRTAGLSLLAPLLLWIATGLLFHVKPGWDEAYETLAAPPPGPFPWERVVFSPAAVKARGLLDPGPVTLAPHPAGLVAYFGRRGGVAAAVDGTSGEAIPPASEEVARVYASEAVARSRHAGRYGTIVSAEETVRRSARTGGQDPAFLFRTSSGWRLVVDRVTGEVEQEGPTKARIELLYRAHYLQWTPWAAVNAGLVLAATVFVLVLAGSGLHLALTGTSCRPRGEAP
jgi:uncharacterized iron-regulated membrane protein